MAAKYADTCGAPVIFPRRYFGELRSLHGDTGAKSLLRRYIDEVYTVSMEEAAVDIDTQSDYESLLRRNLLSG